MYHTVVELDVSNQSGMLSDIPRQIGPRRETSVGGIVNASRAAGSMTFRSNAEFATVILSPVDMEAAFSSDRLQKFQAPIGMLVVNPSNIERTLRWNGLKQNAAIAFRPATYSDLAAAELEGGHWELQPPKFGHIDLWALRLAQVMATEVTRPTQNSLYLDSLLTVFGVHLLRHYSSAKQQMLSPTARRLSVQVSRRVAEYMQQNVSDSIPVNELAKISRMSPSHFIRAFKLTFGMPPHQYLVQIRLQRAERLLLETTLPISDIALQTGFVSQSHLTDTMKRYKQITPAKIRHLR
ncbi:helix-turn-helix domain-containing protein [Phyllobacterium myrsinacearum]|uniref:AraC family transcriptional regulator n=1 Tax=Phyllobacterium myrsinacearum TaxID=28101 RepID=A0A839ELS7_9HYPH|nr:AraC family transcriptional regulator [Phyllobacterium myrsinacearum]MBA8881483.1 AraC family transcriptional regulator [Phyllobacterium myrsinacearum]